MLDDRDIQMITKLLEAQKQELRTELLTVVEKEVAPKLRTELLTVVEKEVTPKLRAELLTVVESEVKTKLRTELLTVIKSEVTPQLRLLAEGQEAILEKIVPASRIEALEADVIVLKEAVKYLSEKLQALEKAQ